MSDDQINIHCRICGSFKLNKFHYVTDVSNKLELNQLLCNDPALDQLIRPCECRGEFAYAHKICLANWLEITRHEYCDICRFRYIVRFVERTFFDWIFETQQVKSSLVATCAALLIYYLSALGLLTSRVGYNKTVLDMIVFSTSCIWIVACTASLVIYCHYSVTEFLYWRKINRRVVVDENKSPQLDTLPRPRDVLKSSGFKPGEQIPTDHEQQKG